MKIQKNKKSSFIHIKGKENEAYIKVRHITTFNVVDCMLLIDMVSGKHLCFTFGSEEEAQEQKDYVISAVEIHPKPKP
jgi:hypothetical protein